MKNKKSLWSLLILILLIVGTFYYIFKDNNIKKVLGAMADIHWSYLIIGMFLMLVYIASEGVGIQVILKSFKYKHSYLKCLKYAFLGFYYCSVMPASSGQPVQIYYMNKDDIEVGDASLSIMIITIAYQIGVLLICVLRWQ